DVFAAAHLDVTRFQSLESSASKSDGRAAWAGVYPGPGRFPVRIEVSTAPDKVTALEAVFPWTTNAADEPRQSGWFSAVWNWGLILIVALVARHNWKAGRVDWTGTWRIGVLCSGMPAAAILLLAHRPSDLLLGQAIRGVAAIGNGVIFATFYL